MAKGNKKSKIFCGLIDVDYKKDYKGEAPNLTLQSYSYVLLDYKPFKYIFTIVHDSDIENNRPKTIHLHFFIELYEESTLSKILDELAHMLDIHKECITIDTSNSPYLMIQYLTHKNQPNKTRYSFDDINYRNSDFSELEKRYNYEYEPPKENNPLEDIINLKSLTELAGKYGIEFARKYQSLFKAIKTEQQADIESLYNNYNHIRQDLFAMSELVDKFISTLQNGLRPNEKHIINLDYFIDQFESLKKHLDL